MGSLRDLSNHITNLQRINIDNNISELGMQLQQRFSYFSAQDLIDAGILQYAVFQELQFSHNEIKVLIQERLKILAFKRRKLQAIRSEDGFHYMIPVD